MAKKRTNIDEVNQVLASSGFMFPRTVKELETFNLLYKDEKYELENYCISPEKLIKNDVKLKVSGNSKSNTYFKRVVLAAEIASQLYDEPTFGHVKFQKLVFLCENVEDIGICGNYVKQAAGPFDNKFMHSIDNELKKHKWLKSEINIEKTFKRYSYKPMENFNGHKKYFNSYFAKKEDKILWIINLFRTESTDSTELVATLFASWSELVSNSVTPTVENLITAIYNWSKEKKKFSEEMIKSKIKWMSENKICPEMLNLS